MACGECVLRSRVCVPLCPSCWCSFLFYNLCTCISVYYVCFLSPLRRVLVVFVSLLIVSFVLFSWLEFGLCPFACFVCSFVLVCSLLVCLVCVLCFLRFVSVLLSCYSVCFCLFVLGGLLGSHFYYVFLLDYLLRSVCSAASPLPRRCLAAHDVRHYGSWSINQFIHLGESSGRTRNIMAD